MRAVTRPADPATATLDLNDVARGDGVLFVREGVGVAGRGIAARVGADDAQAFRAAIDHDGPEAEGPDAVAPGPIAVGWVPCAPGAPGELIVPAVVLRKTADGRRWLTTVDGAGEPLAAPAPPRPSAAAYRIDPVTPIATYLAAVEAARDAVRAGSLTKADIAREIAVTADRPIDVHGVLHRLKATFGS